jgi:hypothetical protein
MQYLNSQNAKAVRAKSFFGEVLTTAVTTIYTCPANCIAELTFLHIVNVTGSNTVTLNIYVAAATNLSSLLSAKTKASGDFTTFAPLQIFLSAGDQIRVTTSHAGHVDIIGSVVETFIPVG